MPIHKKPILEAIYEFWLTFECKLIPVAAEGSASEVLPIRKYILYLLQLRIILMKKTKLGEFEELILLTVAVLQAEAYGVEIKRELERRMKQRLSVGSVQSALKRLEDKGFLKSELGEATQKRGGKRKRIYTITRYAQKVLAELKDIRAALWESIPQLTVNIQST